MIPILTKSYLSQTKPGEKYGPLEEGEDSIYLYLPTEAINQNDHAPRVTSCEQINTGQ